MVNRLHCSDLLYIQWLQKYEYIVILNIAVISKMAVCETNIVVLLQ